MTPRALFAVVCAAALAATAWAQQPVFRTEAALVTNDVVVRDAKGNFIQDLKPSEFILLEDGVPQKLLSIELHVGNRSRNVLSTSAPPKAPGGMILPSKSGGSDTSGRLMVIFVDDLHLQAGDTSKVKQILRTIKDKVIHSGDLFCFQTTGPSSVFLECGYNLQRLDEAINHIMGAGQSPSEIIRSGQGSEGPIGVRYNARSAMKTAYDLLLGLEKYNDRRKMFFYVSNGYDFDPFPNARADHQANMYALPDKSDPTGMGTQKGRQLTADEVNPFGETSTKFAATDLVAEIAELTRQANRANTVFFPIDPRGLTAGPSMADNDVRFEDWNNYVRHTTDGLRVMASETGGLAIVNNNDFDGMLAQIDNSFSDYYLLGYQSSNPDPLHRSRTMTVRVTRSGAVVTSSRALYTIKPPSKSGR